MREALTEDRLPKLIRYFLTFALVYYGYVYAFPFEQGVSAAPAPVKAIKDLVYFGMFLALLGMLPWCRLSGRLEKPALVFVPFLAALVIVSALHASHTGLKAQAWENIKNIALYVPLYLVPFLVGEKTFRAMVRDLFVLLPAMGVIQCLFVLVYHGSGHALWADGIYSGLIGNPNSFALFLNLGIACLLATLPSRNTLGIALSCGAIGLFTLTILGTTSGSQFVILWFLLLFALVFRLKHWRYYLVAILVSSCATFLSAADVDKTLFTMKGVGAILAGVEDPLVEEQEYVSRSVTSRKENWEDTIAVFSKSVDDIVFGDFDTPNYKPMDGQYLVFMFNGGLLTLLSFLAAAAFVYLRSLVGSWKSQDNHLFGLNLMIAAFGITFLASRVLMYFPFNFLFFLIAGLAVAQAREVAR